MTAKHYLAATQQLRHCGQAYDAFGLRARQAGGYTQPIPEERVLIYRAIATSGDDGADNLTALAERLLANGLGDDWGASMWPRRSVGTLVSILKGGLAPPEDDYATLIKHLKPEAMRALGRPREDLDRVEQLLHLPVASLAHSLRPIFGVPALDPHLDPSLVGRPYWKDPRRVRRASDATPAELVNMIMRDLTHGPKRLIWLHGEVFSAKREIMKAIVERMSEGYLLTEAGTLMPVFAQAMGATTDRVLLNEAYAFFCGPRDPAQGLVGELSDASKLAFIRAAAKQPIVLLLEDVEPFDQDTGVRNLRKGVVGDLIEAVLDGNAESRVVVAINSVKDEHLPWRHRAEARFVSPSREVFLNLLNDPTQCIRLPDRAADRLSGLALQVSLLILRRGRDGTLSAKVADAFRRIVLSRDPKVEKRLFELYWNRIAGFEDRVLLGLIAGSFDGLRLKTLTGIVDALKAMHHNDPAVDAAIKGLPEKSIKDLYAWRHCVSELVRWRPEGQDACAAAGPLTTFYMREPIRRLVLQAWRNTEGAVWRDAFWCGAREAAHQARTHPDGPRSPGATALYLQALYGLLASIDPAQVCAHPVTSAPTYQTVESIILPHLSIKVAQRPDPTLAYQFAYRELYKDDIEGGAESLLDIDLDPGTQLEAILAFLDPSQPWLRAADRRLLTTPEAMGPALVALEPHERIDLLRRIARAAMWQGRFDLLMAAVRLGELPANRPMDGLGRVVLLALQLIEVDLGQLYGGNPAWVDADLSPADPEPLSLETPGGRLSGVTDRLTHLARSHLRVSGSGKALINGVLALDNPHETPLEEIERAYLEGMLALKNAEVWQLQRDNRKAARAFKDAVIAERRLMQLYPSLGGRSILLAGRGIRRWARFILDGHFATKETWISFPDGLNWPTMKSAKRRRIARVRQWLDINRREAGRGHQSGRIGVMIDDARLELARGRFAEALAHAEAAAAATGRYGGPYEQLLEMAALRARILIEYGMDRAQRPKVSLVPNDPSLESLHISAKAASEALDRLIGGRPLQPYICLSYFFRAQVLLLESRLRTPRSPGWRQLLEAAHVDLTTAHREMETIEYRLWSDRVLHTREAIDAAIASGFPDK